MSTVACKSVREIQRKGAKMQRRKGAKKRMGRVTQFATYSFLSVSIASLHPCALAFERGPKSLVRCRERRQEFFDFLRGS
jgi:hypothetical protein